MIDNSAIGSILGAPALSPDGDKIGTVGQVFAEPHTNTPKWATVHTGLFGRHETFVPLDKATFDRESLHLPYDKDTIKDAPRIDTDGPLSPEAEAQLHEYYGLTPDVPTSPDAAPSTSSGNESTHAEPVEAPHEGSSESPGQRHPDQAAAEAGAEFGRESRMEHGGPDGDRASVDAEAGAEHPSPRRDGPKHRA